MSVCACVEIELQPSSPQIRWGQRVRALGSIRKRFSLQYELLQIQKETRCRGAYSPERPQTLSSEPLRQLTYWWSYSLILKPQSLYHWAHVISVCVCVKKQCLNKCPKSYILKLIHSVTLGYTSSSLRFYDINLVSFKISYHALKEEICSWPFLSK